MKDKVIINMTPNLVIVAGKQYPPSGKVATVEYTVQKSTKGSVPNENISDEHLEPLEINGAPICEVTSMKIVGLPSISEDTFYIVLPEVFLANKICGRPDLLCVHIHPEKQRDQCQQTVFTREFVK